jgi:oxalate---CoA ligase
VLLSHEAVAEAVCFAVPDEMYGQEIHTAVVVKQGKKVAEKELQQYVAKKVAKFKIPKKVLSLEEKMLIQDLLYKTNPKNRHR